MSWVTIILGVVGIASVVTTVYFLARRRFPQDAVHDLEPELSITRKNGWALLDLVLQNRSDVPIWAEHATFALADLDADFQGADASGEGMLLIRETLRPHGMLRISLIETVYKAAGKPQGEYSFLISGMVRYRSQESNWFEMTLQTYRVRMIALSAIRLLRMRWYDQSASAAGARTRVRRVSIEDDERKRQSNG